MAENIKEYLEKAKGFLDGAFENTNNITDRKTAVLFHQLIKLCDELIKVLKEIDVKQEVAEQRRLKLESETNRHLAALEKRIRNLEMN